MFRCGGRWLYQHLTTLQLPLPSLPASKALKMNFIVAGCQVPRLFQHVSLISFIMYGGNCLLFSFANNITGLPYVNAGNTVFHMLMFALGNLVIELSIGLLSMKLTYSL